MAVDHRALLLEFSPPTENEVLKIESFLEFDYFINFNDFSIRYQFENKIYTLEIHL